MPELSCDEDMEHLRSALALDLTDAKAANHFTKLIEKSLQSKMTILNDIGHIWVTKM